MKGPCLPLPAVHAPAIKILPTKKLNIAEPRIFCPLKITRYMVCHQLVNVDIGFCGRLDSVMNAIFL